MPAREFGRIAPVVLFALVPLALAAALSISSVSDGASDRGFAATDLGSGPQVSVPDTVTAGGTLSGFAVDLDFPVTVSVVDDNGDPLPGSPDTNGFGEINPFSFDVPVDAVGPLHLRATDDLGNYTDVYISVL